MVKVYNNPEPPSSHFSLNYEILIPLAKISKNAYTTYYINEEKQTKISHFNVDNYTRLEPQNEIKKLYSEGYYNQNENTLVISFKGTSQSNVNDIRADANIA